MSDDEPQGFTQTKMQEGNEMEGDADPPEVFGGRMPQDIIQCITSAVEVMQHFLEVFLRFFGENRFCGLHLEHAAIGSWHDLLVSEVAKPGASEVI